METVVARSKAGLAWTLSQEENKIVEIKRFVMMLLMKYMDSFSEVKQSGFADESHPLNSVRIIKADDHNGTYLTITIRSR